MAIRVGYLARETASNLFRNVLITLASIMTVFVSLTLVGASLMAQQGVENATRRWQGGVEFIIFMEPVATDAQISGLDNDLREDPNVESVSFVNKRQAYDEFQELFRDSPEMIAAVENEEILPTSFRVEPKDKSADVVQVLSEKYEKRDGVRQVESAQETIRLIQRFSEFLTIIILVVAVALLATAVVLILTTIMMAMYSRRREIEVMKLVGATNWFIRVPFMAEGLIQGIVGAAAAVATLAIVRPLFEGWLPPPDQFPIFSGFVPATADMLPIYLLLILVGCLVGVVGAGIAVTLQLWRENKA